MRKTAATVFEQASVPAGFNADIIGYEKQTVTYGLKLVDTSIKRRQEAKVKL